MNSTPPILFRNGRVITMSNDEAVAEAFLVKENRIAWVGSNEDAPLIGNRINLKGRTVIPGLTDAHVHLLASAQEGLQIDLGTPRLATIAQVQDTLATEAQRRPKGEWIVACRFNEAVIAERRLLSLDDLDAVSSDHPILVRRYCGHLAMANSVALSKAGVGQATPDPADGEYERRNGRFTGVLREMAAAHLFAIVPAIDSARLKARMREIAHELLGYGVTSFCEASVGFTNGFDAEWNLWRELKAEGGFPLRAVFMLGLDPDEAERRALRPGPVDPDWQVRTLKFFADGIVGARTAVFDRPYVDGLGCGAYITTPESMRRHFAKAHAQNWQIAVHAIGDAAIRETINAIDQASAGGNRSLRHRIEHLGFPTPEMFARLARSGIGIVTQYAFLPSMGDSFIRAVGPTRGQAMYFGRALVDAGVILAGGSDGPTGPLSPFTAIASAIERKTGTGVVVNLRESLSLGEALGIYTRGAAACIHQEHLRGQIRAGLLADFSILDTDILECDLGELAATRASEVYRNGQRVGLSRALGE